jgi:crossover junction endodeoxyribonuclease RuvC
MRILGIDPGTRKCGFAIIDKHDKGFDYVASGTIRMSATRPMELRLLELSEQLESVIKEHRPERVSLEDVFVQKNVQSALKINLARGVVMLIAAKKGLSFKAYPPAKVKQVVTGRGNAPKTMMQRRVKMLCKLDAEPQEDAADAIGIAICDAALNGA